MGKNLAALIKVKTIVTLVVTLVFAILALWGKISTEQVMNVVTMVVCFYFGTQAEKNATDAPEVKEGSLSGEQ